MNGVKNSRTATVHRRTHSRRQVLQYQNDFRMEGDFEVGRKIKRNMKSPAISLCGETNVSFCFLKEREWSLEGQRKRRTENRRFSRWCSNMFQHTSSRAAYGAKTVRNPHYAALEAPAGAAFPFPRGGVFELFPWSAIIPPTTPRSFMPTITFSRRIKQLIV